MDDQPAAQPPQLLDDDNYYGDGSFSIWRQQLDLRIRLGRMKDFLRRYRFLRRLRRMVWCVQEIYHTKPLRRSYGLNQQCHLVLAEATPSSPPLDTFRFRHYGDLGNLETRIPNLTCFSDSGDRVRACEWTWRGKRKELIIWFPHDVKLYLDLDPPPSKPVKVIAPTEQVKLIEPVAPVEVEEPPNWISPLL